MHIHTLRWTPRPSPGAAGQPEPGLPVVLLHGSPGAGDNFAVLGPLLTESPVHALPTRPDTTRMRTRDVYAFDLPGFGRSSLWIPDYSVQSAAVALRDALDGLGIERAHIVGWSNGGGAGLELAGLDPDRVASLTLLASVGLQETEGSGSYWFEHAKYALGYATLVVGVELVPHFGVLGPVSGRHSFLRSFFDTDQRRLRDIMNEVEVPVLVLHGRRDFLTAAWGARAHHAAMPGSSLVMLESDHFLPMTQPGLTRDWLGPYLAYHDAPEPTGPPPYVGILDTSTSSSFGAASDALGRLVRWPPWWLSGMLLLLFGRIVPRWALAVGGVLVGIVQFDIGVAWVALTAGRLLRFEVGEPTANRVRHTLWAITAPGLGLGSAFLLLHIVGVPYFERSGWPGWLALVLCVLVVRVLIALAGALPTSSRRHRLMVSWYRARNHEFWPVWAIYGPVAPWILWLMIRHRSIRMPTRCNPALTRLGSIGGGLAFDQKSAVLAALGDHPMVLASRAVDPEPRETLASSIEQAISELGGLPVAIKPDTGERGRGVLIARSHSQVRETIHTITERTVVQRYHPGPLECGVFWIRTHEGGSIFSITRKHLPTVVGDGANTVAALVRRDPELRARAAVLEREAGDRWGAVPAAGESVTISEVANHARGAMFRDGADLASPELESSIRACADVLDGFDFGRFDLRYADEGSLRKGKEFAVIEVNGLASESTNIYDPAFGAFRAWRVLGAQWTQAFRIGRSNQQRGIPAASWASLLGAGLRLLK